MRYHMSNTNPRAVNDGIFGQEEPAEEKPKAEFKVGMSIAFTALAVGWYLSATLPIEDFERMYR